MKQVYPFRHGEAYYKQRETTMEEARDLTPEGREGVRTHARNLIARVEPLPRQIISSPYGRCLDTSREIQKECVLLHLEQPECQIAPELAEVHNFEWNLFYPLVAGGEIEYEGEVFNVNAQITNPENLTPTVYFRRDKAHTLPTSARNILPHTYLERIATFERAHEATKRFDNFLNSLPEGVLTILCTHEALTGKYIAQATGKENAFLGRGKYFMLQNQGNEWKPHLFQANHIEYDSKSK